MDPRGKKFIALFLVFSLVMLSVNLYAKERRGATLIITKKDGQQIEGELITVKPKSLLLLDTEGKGVSVGIADIKVIRIVKKSKLGKGLLYGLLIGGGGGGLFGILFGPRNFFGDDITALEDAALHGIVLAPLGLLIGAAAGIYVGIDKKIRIEGYPSEINENLEKLRKKARFKTEVPKNFKQVLVPAKISRIHLTVDRGYFNSQAFDYKRMFGTVGLGGDESLIGPFDAGISDQHPYFKNFKIEYSINRKFALGFMFSPLQELELRWSIIARCKIEDPYWGQNEYENYECPLTGEHKGNFYYLTAAYMPLPETFYKKSSFKVGTGIGLSVVNLNVRTDDRGSYGYSEIEFDSINFSKKSLCFVAFGEYNFYFNRNLSIGVNVEYKYIPVRIEAFQLSASYGYFGNGEYKQFHSSVIDFYKHRVNFGGFGIGINFGFHL